MKGLRHCDWCGEKKPADEFTLGYKCDDCVKRWARPPRRGKEITARPRNNFRSSQGFGVVGGHFEGGKRGR